MAQTDVSWAMRSATAALRPFGPSPVSRSWAKRAAAIAVDALIAATWVVCIAYALKITVVG